MDEPHQCGILKARSAMEAASVQTSFEEAGRRNPRDTERLPWSADSPQAGGRKRVGGVDGAGRGFRGLAEYRQASLCRPPLVRESSSAVKDNPRSRLSFF